MRPHLVTTLSKLHSHNRSSNIPTMHWCEHYIDQVVQSQDFGSDYTDALVQLGEWRGLSLWKYGEPPKLASEWEVGGYVNGEAIAIMRKAPPRQSFKERLAYWYFETHWGFVAIYAGMIALFVAVIVGLNLLRLALGIE